MFTHTREHAGHIYVYFFLYKRVNEKCDTNLKTKRGKFGILTSV